MKITSVERDKKNKRKLFVYVDGQLSFTISEDDYLKLNLYDKKEISYNDISNIKNYLNYNEAKKTAIKYLLLKLHSEKEIYDKLSRDGYEDTVIKRVLEELKDTGYVDDRKYARKFLYDRIKLKPQPKSILKLKLLKKGIEESLINEVLEEWEADEAVMAEELIKQKFGKYDLQDEKIKRRVYSFLVYRGFNHDIIDDIINNMNKK